MSRAVLLSTCGDPFILLTCVKLWQDRWRDEVNTLYINYNNHQKIPTGPVGECLSYLVKDPRIVLTYHSTGIGNGPPQVENLMLCKEDLVMLLEDDGFIFEPGKVDECFGRIESGEVDILGSPRGSCGPEVWESARIKYGLNYEGLGDRGPTWWPNFLFCKKSDLMKTDLDFGSKEYTSGKYFKEVDHTFEKTEYSDTFAWASLQLRHLGLKSADIPQHHASPYEIDEFDQKTMNWANGNPPWIHGGSLSTSWNGYLSGNMPDLSHEAAVLEMETRVAFWRICSDYIDGFTDFKKEYRQGIENLTTQGQLNRGRINRKMEIYRQLMRI